MASFALRRILQSIVMVMAIAVAVFIVLRLSAGDPAKIRAPVFASPEVVEQYRHDFGTDRPLLAQLGSFFIGPCTAISASPSASMRLSCISSWTPCRAPCCLP